MAYKLYYNKVRQDSYSKSTICTRVRVGRKCFEAAKMLTLFRFYGSLVVDTLFSILWPHQKWHLESSCHFHTFARSVDQSNFRKCFIFLTLNYNNMHNVVVFLLKRGTTTVFCISHQFALTSVVYLFYICDLFFNFFFIIKPFFKIGSWPFCCFFNAMHWRWKTSGFRTGKKAKTL